MKSMNSNQSRYQTFEAFWPFYLSQHSNLTCRRLHVLGTSLALIFFGFCFITQKFSLLPISLFFGYGFSWIGHFVFEKNRPATFIYPKWSFLGDFKMLQLFYTGKLGQEIKKFSVGKP